MTAYFEDKEFNPFMGAPGSAMALDDFDGDNFDHGGLGFLGGARFGCGHADGRPIGYRPVPPGTPRWGSDWKRATEKWYHHTANIAVSGSNYANRYNYLDLDPTYKDQLGRPLLRLTYNFVENDYKMSEYCVGMAVKIARAMNPTMMGPPRMRRGDYDITPYQSTHNTGGTDHGDRPADRAWSIAICSAGTPTTSSSWGRPPSRSSQPTIRPDRSARSPTGRPRRSSTKYLKSPGPLVHA